MKRILFIFLCLAFAIHIQAQDTIRYPMDCYMYKEKLPGYHVPITLFSDQTSNTYCLRYIPTDTTVVYGFAMTYIVKDDQTSQLVSHDSVDYDFGPTLYIPQTCVDSFFVYTYGGQMTHIDSLCDGGCLSIVEQINTTSENNLRKDLTFRYEYDLPSPGYTDVHCTEFYFKTPHQLKDTFYIGLSEYLLFNLERFSIHPVGLIVHGWVDSSAASAYTVCGKDYFDKLELITNNICLEIKETSVHYVFRNTDSLSGWGGYFPIVKLRCTPVKGLSLMGQGKGWARIGWRRFVDEGISYDLELVKYNTGSGGDTVILDDTLLLSLTDTVHLFADLDLGGHYAYRVRKHCRYATTAYDTTVASEWTPRKYFDIDTYDLESVDNAPAADFGLSPNPAHGAATLALRQPADADARVEVTDALGRTVLVQPLPAGADRVTLDLSRLSAGTYLVKLLTPRATAAHRLIVW